MPFSMDHHSEWLSSRSDFGNLTSDQKHQLKKIVSYILCVYAPSFAMIHLHPNAPEGLFLTLFQRNLLFAHREIVRDITNLVISYYLEHTSQWHSWKNVCIEKWHHTPLKQLKLQEFLPEMVDVRSQLQDRFTLFV